MLREREGRCNNDEIRPVTQKCDLEDLRARCGAWASAGVPCPDPERLVPARRSVFMENLQPDPSAMSISACEHSNTVAPLQATVAMIVSLVSLLHRNNATLSSCRDFL